MEQGKSRIVVLAERLGDHGFIDDWGQPAKTMPVRDVRLFGCTGDTYRIDHGYLTYAHQIWEAVSDGPDSLTVRIVKVIDAIGGMGYRWRELDESGTGLIRNIEAEWVDARDGLPFTIDGAPAPAQQIRTVYGHPRTP